MMCRAMSNSNIMPAMRIKGEIIDNITQAGLGSVQFAQKDQKPSAMHTASWKAGFAENPPTAKWARHLNMGEEELHNTMGKSQMFTSSILKKWCKAMRLGTNDTEPGGIAGG